MTTINLKKAYDLVVKPRSIRKFAFVILGVLITSFGVESALATTPDFNDGAGLFSMTPHESDPVTRADDDCVDGLWKGRNDGYWLGRKEYACREDGEAENCRNRTADHEAARVCAGKSGRQIDQDDCPEDPQNDRFCFDVALGYYDGCMEDLNNIYVCAMKRGMSYCGCMMTCGAECMY